MKKIQRTLLKLGITAVCLYVLWFYGCNSICFYENVDGEDMFVISENITEDGLSIGFNYLEQWIFCIPWSDAEMSLGYMNAAKNENFQAVSVTFDIFHVNNNKKIVPMEENIDLIRGDVRKRYKYSCLLPRKVLAKVKLCFNYDGEYYEYSHEAIIVKKRNISWWEIAMGI
jgi:hypothetical protein